MLYYQNGLHSIAGWPYEKVGYELSGLNWIIRRIYFFHQNVYHILFMFHQCNNCLILQQNWLHVKRENILSSAMITKQCKYVDWGIQFDHEQNNEKLSHGVTRWNQ